MNMATPTSPTKELMEGIRVKRLPAYLRSQLQNAMDQFPDDPATNLIIQSLTLHWTPRTNSTARLIN